MRGLLICLCAFALSCGDNVKPGTVTDAAVTDDGSIITDGTPTDGPPIDGAELCGNGTIDPGEACDDAAAGPCCTSCQFAVGTECRASARECDAAETCNGASDQCPADADAPDGTPCSTGFCTNGTCSMCNATIDADFDGSNQCLDCNDTNGAVFPQANERACDGLDDDCDGQVDENYDMDNDNYSTCSDDPTVRDCDDTRATVHPGAPELCGANNAGNNIDENCNGYTDENCTGCDTVDNDGDGRNECQGDCDDTRGDVSPTKPEVCDGVDTDCNTNTVDNCDVSDPCNFTGNADVCKDDLQCGCVVNTSGQCTGDYRCASFCEGSFTGPLGAGCTATQACMYRWTLSNNQHACGETTATLGTKLAGAVCTADTECRSGNCDRYCTGPGCTVQRCVDYCDHHEPDAGGGCATGTVCEPVSGPGFMYATCRLDDNGTRTTGQACTGGCLWGPNSCVNNVCAAPCGENSQCGAGFHCSLRGNRTAVGTWSMQEPPGVAGQTAVETVPVCLADSGAGAHDRPGGAACTQNGDCNSQFCDRRTNVCVDMCVTDSSCAVGLTCEPVFLRAVAGTGITWGRACVNASFGAFLEAK